MPESFSLILHLFLACNPPPMCHSLQLPGNSVAILVWTHSTICTALHLQLGHVHCNHGVPHQALCCTWRQYRYKKAIQAELHYCSWSSNRFWTWMGAWTHSHQLVCGRTHTCIPDHFHHLCCSARCSDLCLPWDTKQRCQTIVEGLVFHHPNKVIQSLQCI